MVIVIMCALLSQFSTRHSSHCLLSHRMLSWTDRQSWRVNIDKERSPFVRLGWGGQFSFVFAAAWPLSPQRLVEKPDPAASEEVYAVQIRQPQIHSVNLPTHARQDIAATMAAMSLRRNPGAEDAIVQEDKNSVWTSQLPTMSATSPLHADAVCPAKRRPPSGLSAVVGLEMRRMIPKGHEHSFNSLAYRVSARALRIAQQETPGRR